MGAPFWTSYVLLWILVLVQCVAIFALYHHFAQMYLGSREGRQSQGPELGARFDDLILTAIGGESRAIRASGRPSLVVLASTTCRVCSALRSDIGKFAARHRDIDISVVCDGSPAQVQEWSRGLDQLVPVFPDQSHRIPASLDVGMTPYLIGIDLAGIVRAKGLVNDFEGLELAARETLEAQSHETNQDSVKAQSHG